MSELGQALPCATVVIVEDDQDTRNLLVMLLEEEGHRCVAVGSGAEAIELCKANHFDCMLLDGTLGGMSGVSVAQRLGGHASAIRPNHIYLLTGHPKSDFTSALRDGIVDGHILKPADLNELAEVVKNSIARARPLG